MINGYLLLYIYINILYIQALIKKKTWIYLPKLHLWHLSRTLGKGYRWPRPHSWQKSSAGSGIQKPWSAVKEIMPIDHDVSSNNKLLILKSEQAFLQLILMIDFTQHLKIWQANNGHNVAVKIYFWHNHVIRWNMLPNSSIIHMQYQFQTWINFQDQVTKISLLVIIKEKGCKYTFQTTVFGVLCR